jgi:hypothetical protein
MKSGETEGAAKERGVKKEDKGKLGDVLMSYIVLSLPEHTLVQPNEILLMETSRNVGKANVYTRHNMQIQWNINVLKTSKTLGVASGMGGVEIFQC